jgi:hypothetical protein
LERSGTPAASLALALVRLATKMPVRTLALHRWPVQERSLAPVSPEAAQNRSVRIRALSDP